MELIAPLGLLAVLLLGGTSFRDALAARDLRAVLAACASMVANGLTLVRVMPFTWRLAVSPIVLWLLISSSSRNAWSPDDAEDANRQLRAHLRNGLLLLAIAEVLAVVLPIIVQTVIVHGAFSS